MNALQPFDSITITYVWKQGADAVALLKLDSMTHDYKIKWKPGAIKQWGKKKRMDMSGLYGILCPNCARNCNTKPSESV